MSIYIYTFIALALVPLLLGAIGAYLAVIEDRKWRWIAFVGMLVLTMVGIVLAGWQQYLVYRADLKHEKDQGELTNKLDLSLQREDDMKGQFTNLGTVIGDIAKKLNDPRLAMLADAIKKMSLPQVRNSAPGLDDPLVKLTCDPPGNPDLLPIPIEPGKDIEVARMTWASSEISLESESNHNGASTKWWPAPASQIHPNQTAFHCAVENHGAKTLTNLKIPFTFGFMSDDPSRHPNVLTLDILDRAGQRSFWLINSCPHFGYFGIPFTGTAQVVGEKAVRPLSFIGPDGQVRTLTPGFEETGVTDSACTH